MKIKFYATPEKGSLFFCIKKTEGILFYKLTFVQISFYIQKLKQLNIIPIILLS